MRIRSRKLFFGLAAAGFIAGGLSAAAAAQNQPPARDFSLQVSPSPIVQTVKPGVQQTTELRIKNNGNQAEELKIELRDFSVDAASGEIKLGDEQPREVKDWVRFANPVFKVERGQTFTQRIILDTPASAGFTYSFALLIKRAAAPAPTGGTQALEGSVAVFTLLDVDRPGAKRKFEIVEFATKKRVYEYLPTEFTLRAKNTGNTLVQPAGNIFVQRGSNSAEPLAVLPANPTGGYILPGMTRSFTSSWEDGFPVYKTRQAAAGVEPQRQLAWDWGNLGKFRIGKYVAKVVTVYNDGERDVPVEAEVSFWVVPWKLLLGVLIVALIMVIGIASLVRGTFRLRRKAHQTGRSGQPLRRGSNQGDDS